MTLLPLSQEGCLRTDLAFRLTRVARCRSRMLMLMSVSAAPAPSVAHTGTACKLYLSACIRDRVRGGTGLQDM